MLPAFDPHEAVRFDLRAGAARDARGDRLLVLPLAAVLGLAESAQMHLGSALGKALGDRLSARFGGARDVLGAPFELVASHLAGEFAVAGLGGLRIEQWGRAMAVGVENSDRASERFVGAVLGGALSLVAGREVVAAVLERTSGETRYFLGSKAACANVRQSVERGTKAGVILAALQRGLSS